MEKILNKRAKGSMTTVAIWVGVVAVVGLLAFMAFGGNSAPAPSSSGSSSTGGIQPTASQCSVACPDDLDWAGTINVRNKLNSTGAENFDTTTYFYEADGSLKTSITDTTSGAATLTCGNTYAVKVQSTSGAAGDSGAFIDGSGYTANPDGTASLTACGSGSTITFVSRQHGLPEIRVRDNVNDGLAFSHGNDDDAVTYQTTDGAVFGSSTNGSAIAVGAGGNLEFTQFVRATADDQNVNDLGMWILIDAGTSIWDKPAVKIDGASASEASAQLSADEKIAYNGYEYVFFVPASRVIDNNDKLEINIDINALGGTNPDGDDNISVDYAPIGHFQSNSDSNVLKVGAVDDSSSRGDVHTRHDTVIWVS
jgi:hypothetical protein